MEGIDAAPNVNPRLGLGTYQEVANRLGVRLALWRPAPGDRDRLPAVVERQGIPARMGCECSDQARVAFLGAEYQQQSYISYVPAVIPEIRLGDTLRKLAHDYEMHSLSLWQVRRLGEAQAAQTQADGFWSQLRDCFSHDPTYRLEMAAARAKTVEAHRAAGRIAESQEVASDTVRLYKPLTVDFPSDYRVHREFAYMYGELGQWHEATKAYRQAAELDPDPASRCRWYESALLPLLGAGDLEAYRAGCEDLLQRYGDTEDPATAWWLVGICLYVPDAVRDTDCLVKLAKMTGNPAIEAAALYRAGYDKEAAERVRKLASSWEEPDQLQVDPLRPFKRLLGAMALHQIGHTEAARQLERVNRWLDETQPDHSGFPVARIDRLNWCYRVTLNLMRREAEELLRKSPTSENP